MDNFETIAFESKEFKGANTYHGFKGFYDEMIYSFAKRHKDGAVYVIKGGPGTGKSTFMKKVAELLDKAGCDVNAVRCSGDTGSLDGVYSEVAGIMVIDGTAPHCTEAGISGVNGELINFGQFWNRRGLIARRKEIEAFTARKQLAYASAYGYLAAAQEMKHIAENVSSKQIEKNILNVTIESMLDEIQEEYGSRGIVGTTTHTFATAVTSNGIYGGVEDVIGVEAENYSFYVFQAPRWINIGNEMSYIGERLLRNGFDVKLCCCGFDGSAVEHVIVPEIKCAFVTANEHHGIDNVQPVCKYFIESMYERNLSLDERDLLIQCRLKFDELMIKAQYALKDALDVHKRMEECYIESMNFKELDMYCSGILENIQSIISESGSV